MGAITCSSYLILGYCPMFCYYYHDPFPCLNTSNHRTYQTYRLTRFPSSSFLPFPSPQVHREGILQLSQTLCKLQESRCMIWTLSYLGYGSWTLSLGIYAFLLVIYASLLNNQDRNYGVMFWKLF